MRVEPTHAFLVLGSVFGLAFLILTPPLQAPDEIRHLTRVYRLSEGAVLPDHAEPYAQLAVPRSLVALDTGLAPGLAFHPERRLEPGRVLRAFEQELAPESRVRVAYASLYSPLPYLGSALGVAGARLAGASPAGLVYAGRAFNLAVFLALAGLALTLAGAHHYALLGIALLPMSLAEAASISADPVTTGLALLFVALLLRERRSHDVYDLRAALPLLVVAAAIGLAKPVYWPLVALVGLVPPSRFLDDVARVYTIAVVVLVSALPMLFWSFVIGSYSVLPLGEGADPAAQIAHLASDPFAALRLPVVTTWRLAGVFFETMVGVFGHVDAPLPTLAYAGYALLLGSLALVPESERIEPLRVRLGLLGVAALLYLAVLASGYVGWNPPGADWVRGVQGRYFLPFAVLLLMALGQRRLARYHAALALPWLAAMALGLAVAVGTVYLRYYGPL